MKGCDDRSFRFYVHPINGSESRCCKTNRKSLRHASIVCSEHLCPIPKIRTFNRDTKGIGESFPEKLTVSFWLLFKMEKENHKLWIQPFPSDIEPILNLSRVILDFLQFAFHVYLQRVLIRTLYLIVFSDWSLWIVTILKLIFKLFDCVNVFFVCLPNQSLFHFLTSWAESPYLGWSPN